MSGKPTVKNELTEELMEAVSILSNFSSDIDAVISNLNINETLDHENDRLRNEAVGFFLDSLEAYNAKDYEGMQKFIHAGIQKMHQQAEIDFKDDKPRVDVRIKLSEVRCKAVFNQGSILKLIGKLGGRNAGSSR